MRALLVLELRTLRVTHTSRVDKLPAHLPMGSSALRCEVQTASIASVAVVLGGPPDGESRESVNDSPP